MSTGTNASDANYNSKCKSLESSSKQSQSKSCSYVTAEQTLDRETRCERKKQQLAVEQKRKNSQVKKWLQSSVIDTIGVNACRLNQTEIVSSKTNTFKMSTSGEVVFKVSKETHDFTIPKAVMETRRTTRSEARKDKLLKKLQHEQKPIDPIESWDNESVTNEVGEHDSVSVTGKLNFRIDEDQGTDYTDHDQQSESLQTEPKQDEIFVETDKEEGSQIEKEDGPNEGEQTVIEQDPMKILDSYKERLEQRDQSVFYDMFELMIMKMTAVQNNISQVQKDPSHIEQKG